jgi:hypothetical protein
MDLLIVSWHIKRNILFEYLPTVWERRRYFSKAANEISVILKADTFYI